MKTGQLPQLVVNAATTMIITGGQTEYFNFQLARIAIPKTISARINTQAQNEGAHENNAIPDNMPVIVPGPITKSFKRPGISISNPRRMRLTVKTPLFIKPPKTLEI